MDEKGGKIKKVRASQFCVVAGNKESSLHNYIFHNKKNLFFSAFIHFSLQQRRRKNGIQNSSAMGIEALRHGNRRSWKRPCFRFAYPFPFFHSLDAFLVTLFLLTCFGNRFRSHGLWLLILCSVLHENPSHIEFCRYHTMPNYYYYYLFSVLYIIGMISIRFVATSA